MALDPPVVDVRGVTKTFRDFWLRPKVRAVRDISFSVNKGEIYGLLGPNGAGKSTTIKMLLGLLFPTRGQIAILGRHPRENAVKKFLGYMPEDSYLYPYLTAEETLRFYGKVFGYSGKTLTDRVEMLLDMIGLRGASQRPIVEYSKGMARRVALAQALINDPQMVILDEPTTGMDPLGNQEFKELIRQLKDRGKTVIICSHLLSDMQDLCDRVAIFYGGSIISEGMVKELLDESESLEHYFLKVVNKARGERETAGAIGGNLGNSFLGFEDGARASHEQKEAPVTQEHTRPSPEEPLVPEDLLSAAQNYAVKPSADSSDSVSDSVDKEKQEPDQSVLDELMGKE